MRRSKLVLSLMTMLSLTGCIAESRDPGQTTGDDPLVYVDDQPADSASRRCSGVDLALTQIQSRFADNDGQTFLPYLAPTLRLRVLETDWDEIAAADAADEISYFTADHAYSSFERLHTLHSRSCASGAMIGEFTDHDKTYRVTIEISQNDAGDAYEIEYFVLEQTIAWDDLAF